MPLHPDNTSYPRLITSPVGPTRLNIDDIQDLISLFEDRTSAGVTVRVGRYVADTAEDFIHASDSDLRDVRIDSNSPPVQALLKPANGARIWTQSDDPVAARLVEDAASLVNSKPLSWRIAYPLPIWLVYAVVIFSGYGLASEATGAVRTALAIGTIVFLVGLFWVTPRPLRKAGMVEIVPMRRHDIRSRRDALKSNVALAILSAILGAILGVAGTLVVGALTASH